MKKTIQSAAFVMCVAAVCVFSSRLAWGQGGTAQISGTVRDAGGLEEDNHGNRERSYCPVNISPAEKQPYCAESQGQRSHRKRQL